MDRISDSGSDGCGSIPHGGTKKAIRSDCFFFYLLNCRYRLVMRTPTTRNTLIISL